MTYTVEFAAQITDKPALHDLLVEYYGIVLTKLARAGGPPDLDPRQVVDEFFWPNTGKVLPPGGRLVLAHDPDGRLVGCGMLSRARADAGELKRLYVRPEANGHGLGRKMVDMRMEAAKEMGYRTLLVNAVAGNEDMLRIYKSLGFRFIPRYPECSDPEYLEPFMDFMQYDFD